MKKSRTFTRMITALILCCAMLQPVVAIESDFWSVDGDNDQPTPGAIDLEVIGGAENLVPASRAELPSYHALSVPFCHQKYDFYCGPATVQQILRFYGDYATTQGQIATAIGTTESGSSLKPMIDYIANRGYVSYQVVKNPSFYDLYLLVGNAIYTYNTPPIGRISFKKGGNWRYTTNGHFLNVSGYDYTYQDYDLKECEIRVTDPFIQWVDKSSNGYYWVMLTEFHQATIGSRSQEFAY